MSNKIICYILGEFPSRTQTFILQEICYISERNPIYIVALRKGKGNIDIPPQLKDKIIYTPSIFSLVLLRAYFKTLKKEPFQKWKEIPRTGGTLKAYAKEFKYKIIAAYISRALKSTPIQHIHAHFAGYPTTIATYLSELLHVPFSFTAHAHDIYAEKNLLSEKIGKAKFVITCTQYNKNYLRTLILPQHEIKIHVLYHGVKIKKWEYKPTNIRRDNLSPLRILTIGRMVEKKGFIYLLQAIQLLKNEGQIVECTIVGRGAEEKMLKQYCLKNNLQKEVTFIGWQSTSTIKQLLYTADLFILPSIITADGDRDGIPNVLMEAMATGLPVISTNISAIPELIKDHYNGLLVPEKNAIAITEAINELLNNPDIYNLLAFKSRKTIEVDFDSNRHNALLKELLDPSS